MLLSLEAAARALAGLAVVLLVLISVHELGHFLVAKAVGIQVLRFSLGFGRPLLAWRRGETEYWVSWLPIGGYVKMAGLEDEGMAGDVEGGRSDVPVDPARAFDRQPLWARAVVLLAGVTMNLGLAFLVYTGLAGTVGVSRTNTTQIDTVWSSVLPKGAEALGRLQRGERIVTINEDSVHTWEEIIERLATQAPPLRIGVAGEQGGGGSTTPILLDVPREEGARLALIHAIDYYFPPRIESVQPGLPADRGGVRPGDLVVRANTDTITSWMQFTRLIRRSIHRPVDVTVVRDGRPVVVRIVPERRYGPDPRTGTDVAYGYVGIGPVTPSTREHFGVIGALEEGARTTVGMVGQIVSIVRGLVSGELSVRQLGGPIAIAQQSGQAARLGWETFLLFLAFVSVTLGVMNLLPIPILDGGQLVFLLAEAVRRRPLSLALRLRLTQVGFVVVVGLILLATSNDLIRLFSSVFGH